MHVYKFTNKINGKIYIGKADDPNKRFKQHLKDANNKYSKKTKFYFYRAIRKYGIDNFIFEIIEKCKSVKESFEKEMYWVKYYNSNDTNKGYNLTPGGNGFGSGPDNPMFGKKHSEEFKKYLSVINSGKNNHFYGKKHTEQTKLKMKEAWAALPEEIKYRPHTPETIAKMTQSRQERAKFEKEHNTVFKATSEQKEIRSERMIGEGNHFYGKHHKLETKIKIVESRFKKKLTTKEIEYLNDPLLKKIEANEAKILKNKIIEKEKQEQILLEQVKIENRIKLLKEMNLPILIPMIVPSIKDDNIKKQIIYLRNANFSGPEIADIFGLKLDNIHYVYKYYKDGVPTKEERDKSTANKGSNHYKLSEDQKEKMRIGKEIAKQRKLALGIPLKAKVTDLTKKNMRKGRAKAKEDRLKKIRKLKMILFI